ncbi:MULTISPECIES: zinc-binding dehydrogenase [unclassified Paenibacillus]|uniref:zinc-binding dehydrogenase n=1 Tax=unclassified Paenibacillus TaxID=185978 RepID=UPI00277DC123|nr:MULTISPECIES: zinc-binding dehydrogenase [unclassified Paenibacillus]MDQ0896817.1 NADPH2:quinone reductase [Paenibacillus sp. V4I7]MDQ0917074.1 NADPH2:quinone reductase [Paenibacillus sp. V4I5]
MVRAIISDPLVAGRFTIREVEMATPAPSEAIVQVKAVSLNRGEVRDALNGEIATKPGWDFAGVVLKSAEDGTGPKKGSRVVGLIPMGAWAEQVAARTSWLSEIPETVTFAQAATLPVAGLSAMYALRKGGLLLQKRVLITGSTGGVGLFAHQLATLAGAYVVGTARTEKKAELVRSAGASEVLVGESYSAASQLGPFHLILDTVGGDILAGLLSQLVSGGICVTMGYSNSPYASIDVRDLIHTGGTTLYGLFLLEELNRYSGADDLRLLAQLVADERLHPRIEVEASWKEIQSIATQLMERQYTGKAVLHIDE